MPMILRTAAASPFGRKVKIAADILGLSDQVTLQASDPFDDEDSLRAQNPLGKIPVLMAEDGSAIYDSRVICEYLDTLAGGGKIFPIEPKARLHALREQALADGMMDAGIVQIYEKRVRPEDKQHAPWLEYQSEKVTRALTYLEENMPVLHHTPTIGEISLACALGYLDFRFNGEWRTTHLKLVEWLEAFTGAVPSYDKTKPPA
ncbi:glutathione S-transferase [Tepidamorphus sp. 3E244]|uniref:glutathione S-transferase n=1 Tax=Tepidamorphus sp. 3E244 TaxID=3385498 RepID=UPI0038FC5F43